MSNYDDLLEELEKSSHETDEKLKKQPKAQEKGKTEKKDGTDNTGPAAVDDEESPGEANQATDNAGVDGEEPDTTGNPDAEVPTDKTHPTTEEVADKNAALASQLKEAINSIQTNMKLALEQEKAAEETPEDSPEDVKNKQVDEEGDTEPEQEEVSDPLEEILDEGDEDEEEGKEDKEDKEDKENKENKKDEEVSMKEAGYITAAAVSNDLIQKEAMTKQAQAEQWVNTIIEKAAADAHSVCDFYDTVAKSAQGNMMGAIPPEAAQAVQGGETPVPGPEALPEGAMSEDELLTTLEMLARGEEPSNDMEAKLKQIMIEAGVIQEGSEEPEETTPEEVSKEKESPDKEKQEEAGEEENEDEEAMKAAALDNMSTEDLKSLRKVVNLLNQEGN